MIPTSYYLSCLETYRYAWIEILGDTASATDVDADLIFSFCLEHQGKSLIVVSEIHQVVEDSHEWLS